ncbi:hypothetical protein ACIOEX_01735 [Streptomyces sp. NPDC087850]|uniref:hypothetical protein n=1 Tax=Streptomyces sp. NPDC087850 TaxID=3365809 RepID=UPI00380C4CBA
MSLFPSVLRTVVPLLAGWALTVLTGLGLNADSTTVASGVTIAVSATYYLLFRLIERAAEYLDMPWFRAAAGVLLGYARPPRYESTDDVEALIRASRQ